MKSYKELLSDSEREALRIMALPEWGVALVRQPGEPVGAWEARARSWLDELGTGFMVRMRLSAEITEAVTADPEWAAHKAALEAEREAQLAAMALAECRARMTKLVPRQPAEMAFTGRETAAVKAVRRWMSAKDSTRHLVLRGGVGTGKSSAAAVYARSLVEPRKFEDLNGNIGDYRVQLSSGRDRLRAVWVRPDQLVSAVMHAYDDKSPKLGHGFVVDDMGRETKADFAEALCTVLDSGEHRMVITTNLTQSQMRERYDARLLDRMNELCVAFDVPGESMRPRDGGF